MRSSRARQENSTMAERALKSVPAKDEAPAAPAQTPSDVRHPPAGEKASRIGRRGSLRWVLFALLPVALIVGGYWYFTGGKIMSTDDAYVDAQQVAEGQVLYRLDPRQFQIALDNAKANLAQTGLMVDSMKQDYQHLLSDAA